MRVVYNDNEPSAAEWLRGLVVAGELPQGEVIERDIRDIGPASLAGVGQFHAFAGIGGWPLALRLAGWPSDAEVWTGSCPCQPFSNAGKRRGTADERHLWPDFARLIGQCRPPIVFGEQVASRDGREWLAGVRLDLEAMGYAVGAADLCAASVGAPQIRQRLYFGAIRLGNADDDRRQAGRSAAPAVGYGRSVDATGRTCSVGVADADGARLARPARIGGHVIPRLAPVERASPWADAEWLDCRDGKARRVKPGVPLLADGLPRDVAPALSGFGNAIVPQVVAQFVISFLEAARDAHFDPLAS